MNGWTAPIILMWPMCEIARSPTATSNTGRCSAARPGAPTIVPCSLMWASICSICCVVVAERLQRQRHRAVDDRHLAAADELLELDQREVRLDAGRVAVHQEGDRAGRREHRRLGVAVAVLLAELDRLVPRARAPRRAARRPRTSRRGSRRRRRGASASRRCAARGSPRSARTGRSPRRSRAERAVGAAGHQRRDRGRRAAARVGVVRHAVGHQVGAEVRVAEPELAERARVVADLLGRVARRRRR